MHIAIIGCGQLSRMLALSGIPMGYTFSFVADANEDTRCVDNLGTIVRWHSGDCVDRLYVELGRPDWITVEKEQVDVNLLVELERSCSVHPNSKAFSVCQHRYKEKQLLDRLGIACAAYIYGQPDDASAASIPLPVVVKSCREGYDGKNQWVLDNQQEIADFVSQASEKQYIVEQKIPFEKEVSQVSVRDMRGAIRHYPLTENVHEKGILKQSVAPAVGLSEQLAATAQASITRIMEDLDYVGVMAMECFLVNDQLLVNELAPRVHNSGHWTQSGSVTCQFENHIRAISGLSTGSTQIRGAAGMINLIGTAKPPLDAVSETSKLHWYNKEVREGRKLGHVNFSGDSREAVLKDMQRYQQRCHLDAAC